MMLSYKSHRLSLPLPSWVDNGLLERNIQSNRSPHRSQSNTISKIPICLVSRHIMAAQLVMLSTLLLSDYHFKELGTSKDPSSSSQLRYVI